MEYQFTGFTHNGEFREFAFDAITNGRDKTRFKVVADLTLSRKYQIAVQELPLLCRRLLERSPGADGARTLTFTESDMRSLAALRGATQDRIVHKKPQRRPKPTATPFQQRLEPARPR